MAKQIVFFGSSPFSNIVLEKLVTSDKCQVTAVVTTEDKPVGRHLKLTPNPVKVLAQKHGISVQYLMSNVQWEPGVVGIVAAYGKIIPQEVLDKFDGQIYNIHPSLLPKYRGPSPLQQQILDGVVDTGVTIIKMDALMDHGPIVTAIQDKILPDDTTISLGNRLFTLGANLILNSQFTIFNQIPISQCHNDASYTKKLTRQDGFVTFKEFENSMKIVNCKLKIARMQRAFVGWPGVWTIDPNGRRIKIS